MNWDECQLPAKENAEHVGGEKVSDPSQKHEQTPERYGKNWKSISWSRKSRTE